MRVKLYRTFCEDVTWPMSKANKLAFQWAEMRMIRLLCGVKVTDRLMCNDRLGIVTAKQGEMVWICFKKG